MQGQPLSVRLHANDLALRLYFCFWLSPMALFTTRAKNMHTHTFMDPMTLFTHLEIILLQCFMQ